MLSCRSRTSESAAILREIKMKEEEERLFKALDILRSAAWDSFDKRRSYEWKFGIAVWTALAVFTGTLLTQPSDKVFQLKGKWPVAVTGLVALMVVAIHAYWSNGISVRNGNDRKISFVYEVKMSP